MPTSYFGLKIPNHECACCSCGKTYEQIRDAGDYCSGCGTHRSDIDSNIFEQFDLPPMRGYQPVVLDMPGQHTFVGFPIAPGTPGTQLMQDDIAHRELVDWVRENIGLDFMLSSFFVHTPQA